MEIKKESLLMCLLPWSKRSPVSVMCLALNIIQPPNSQGNVWINLYSARNFKRLLGIYIPTRSNDTHKLVETWESVEIWKFQCFNHFYRHLVRISSSISLQLFFHYEKVLLIKPVTKRANTKHNNVSSQDKQKVLQPVSV